MRGVILIALVAFAAQLPARDVAHSGSVGAHARECRDKARGVRLPPAGDTVLPLMRLSQSVA
jgi:hypothetical protein